MGVLSNIRADLELSATELLDEYKERLMAEALCLCHNVEEAEDLVMRTFEVYFFKREKYDPGRGSLLVWLRTVMRNMLTDIRRKRKVHEVVMSPEDIERLIDEQIPAALQEDLEQSEADERLLSEAVKALSPKLREAVVLHYFESLPVAEVARALRVSENSVKNRLFYARKVLAKRLRQKVGKHKKSLTVFGLLLLGVTTLFGAYQTGLIDTIVDRLSVDEAPLQADNARQFDSKTSSKQQEKTTMKLASTIVATALAVGEIQAADNLVVNGDFEAGGWTETGWKQDVPDELLPGWTAGKHDRAGLSHPTGVFVSKDLATVNASVYLFLKKGLTSIEQDIVVPAAGLYLLEFDHTIRPTQYGQVNTVFFGGDSIFSWVDTSDVSGVLKHESIEINVVTPGTYTLKFEMDATKCAQIDKATVYDNISLVRQETAGYVTITGAPEEYGLVEPDYGRYSCVQGETTDFTAQPSLEVGDIMYVCSGWKLFDFLDGSLLRDSAHGRRQGESVTCCKIPYQDKALNLEWQWTTKYRVSPVTDDASKGCVEASATFTACGETMELTAVPNDGFAFHHWENVPAGADVWSDVLELRRTTAGALAPKAVFGRVVSVSGTAELVAAVANAESLDVIELSQGTYALDERLVVGKSVRLNGATGKPGDVVLDGQQRCKVVSLAHEFACLSGLTVANGRTEKNADQGGGVYMTAGAVVRCVIADCVLAGNSGKGGGIFMDGTKTLVSDSVVTRCAVGRQGSACGVYSNNGTIRRSEISNCYPVSIGSFTANIYTAIGLDQRGGASLTENCVITNNVATYCHRGYDSVGGVFLVGGELRNSLIAGNSTGKQNETGSKTIAPGGVYVYGTSARLVNCTIIDNTTSRTNSCSGVYAEESLKIANCVIWNNVLAGGETSVAPNWAGNDALFTYCLTTPALSDPHSLSVAPKLRKGRLLPSSAGVDAGCYEDWMDGATDLRGCPRIVRNHVDMGAFETQPIGFSILLR